MKKLAIAVLALIMIAGIALAWTVGDKVHSPNGAFGPAQICLNGVKLEEGSIYALESDGEMSDGFWIIYEEGDAFEMPNETAWWLFDIFDPRGFHYVDTSGPNTLITVFEEGGKYSKWFYVPENEGVPGYWECCDTGTYTNMTPPIL